MITEISIGIYVRLDHLSSMFVQLSALMNSVPLIHFSTDSEPRTGGCSRKVNCVLEPAHVMEILRILHEIVYKLGNRKLPSRNDKLTRFAGASKAFLCKTGVPWCEINCETLRTMSPGRVYTQTNVQPQEHRILHLGHTSSR